MTSINATAELTPSSFGLSTPTLELNRSQYELLRDMPGGIAGLRQMIADFHRRGVKVFFPAMPWDTGTRDEGVPMWEAVARQMAEVGADGVNGDTFAGLPQPFRAASDRTGHPIVFE